MSFVLMHADAGATLLAGDPVVPAAQVPALRDALALLAAAGALRDRAEAAAAAAAAEAREGARATGEAEGRALAQAELGAELVRLGERAQAGQADRHRDVVRLATGVVRRIAGELGPELVAGLAERAAAELAGEQQAVVRVHPTAEKAAARRLAARPQLRVEADPALAPADCVIDSPFGRTLAGLEPQLGRIELAWSQTGGRAPGGEAGGASGETGSSEGGGDRAAG